METRSAMCSVSSQSQWNVVLNFELYSYETPSGPAIDKSANKLSMCWLAIFRQVKIFQTMDPFECASKRSC